MKSPFTPPADSARIPARALASYGLLALPLAALTGPVFAALPTYFVSDLGMDQAAVGLALLIARLWDGISDPLIGIASDRHGAARWRRPGWIALGLPLTIIGAFGLFTLGPALSPLTIGLWSILLYTGWTAMKLNHDALGSELSADYGERTRITAWREGFGLIGGLIAIMLLGWGVAEGGPGLGPAFTLLFWVVAGGLLIGVAGVLTGPQPDPNEARAGFEWRDMLAILRHNRPLRVLAASFFLTQLAAALPATLFLLFVEFALGRPDLRAPFILTYFLCAVLGVPLWQWLSRRIGKHRAWQLGMLVTAAAFLPAVFFREGAEIWFALVCVATGTCLAADLVLPPSMQADVADVEKARTGRRPAGVLFALLGLLSKLAYALAVGVAFAILDGVGFQASPGSANDGVALAWLAGLYALLPALLKLASVVVLRRYALDEAALAKVRAGAQME